MRKMLFAGLLGSSASLVGTTWVFNNDPSIAVTYGNPITYYLDFYDDYHGSANPSTSIWLYTDSGSPSDAMYTMKYSVDRSYTYYYYTGDGQYSWVNSGSKTIHITGGTDATNATLIAWLQANATRQA